jgi:hypothetical protein
MYMTEDIKEKWAPVMEHKDLPEITDPHRRDVTRRLLENQESFLKEQSLSEAAPANSAGAMGDTGGVAKWDPILIALVRRAMPQMIAYDVCGVQPMTGPTGLIFAMKAKYDTQSGDEALFNGARTDQSGDNAPRAHTEITTDAVNPFEAPSPAWVTGTGGSTAEGETYGDGTQPLNAMAFTIEKTTVTARTRALKAEYSTELAQDLKAVHGLDAETELANILSTEITAEINREVVRQIYFTAKKGAAAGTTNQYIFDLDTDSNGRWMVEKFKGLLFQIEREANLISTTTRRGKGNFVITTNDVASAMAMAGVMDYAPAMEANVNNDTHQNTMVGTVNGMKVYVDPYYMSAPNTITEHMFCVGYKGTSPYDAGMFYCPYVPLQMVRAMGENSFQPKIAFKTRYGMTANPFVAQNGAIAAHDNDYYRKVQIANLM